MDENLEILQIVDKMREAINHRELSVEGYYQELKECANRSELEEFIFQNMEYTRGVFNHIDSEMKKHHDRRPKIPGLEKLGREFNMRPMYFDWDSQPIMSWEYHFKMKFFSKHVAEDIINGYRVSTVWLGLDHAFFRDCSPIIFETMIFAEEEIQVDEELKDFQQRYSYLKQAEIGHAEACELVRSKMKLIDNKNND